MLQLLSPAGLWTLAALALPLAIHLWRPPPRTVRLGSLRFLESLPRRLHDLRWRERVLLAARLGMLALLALLLAGPRWLRNPSRDPQRWILVDPGGSPKAGSLARLDALRSAGYEMHALAPGFPVISNTNQGKADTKAPDVWPLLREADALLPAGSSLAVFSPGRLASLRGSRPALRHCVVEWVPTTDTTVAPMPAKPTSPAPLGVLILHDAKRAADARRLAAAIQAAGPANVRMAASNPSMSYQPGIEWLFALDTPLASPTWAAHGANVVSETPVGADQFVASWIVSVNTTFLDPVRLWQRTPPAAPAGAVYWTDGFGQPLLTMTREGQGRHWRFCGRFDSAWTDLPRGSAFPAWLRGLMFARDEHVPDRRLADPSQCRPAQTPASGREVTLSRAVENAVDLRGPLWTLAAAGFILERVLSHRRRPSPVVAAAPPPEPVLA